MTIYIYICTHTTHIRAPDPVLAAAHLVEDGVDCVEDLLHIYVCIYIYIYAYIYIYTLFVVIVIVIVLFVCMSMFSHVLIMFRPA